MAAAVQPAEARLMRPGTEVLEDLSGDEEDDECFDDQDQSQPPGNGPYATLHTEGAQVSTGSVGHPENCMPCTFYCFTRRGCNRGLECRFCHLTHQSKLQQRREAWKKQQREKRKSIRERVAAEAVGRRHPSSGGKGGAAAEASPLRGAGGGLGDAIAGGGGGVPRATALAVGCGNVTTKTAVAAYGLPQGGGSAASPGGCGERRPSSASGEGKAQPTMGAAGGMDVGMAAAAFTYNPSRVTLTIGQEVEMLPQLVAVTARFQLAAPLPQGLVLDQAYGAIRGAPLVACAQKTVVIEAELRGGRTVRTAVEIEVIDFTRGGFVIGHMSEFEPGKFMLLLYAPPVPEEGASSAGGYASDERCPLMLEGVGGLKANANGGRLNPRKSAAVAEQKSFFHGGSGPQVPGGDRPLGKGRTARPQRSGPGGGGRGDLEGMSEGAYGGAAQQQAQQQDWW